MHVLLLEPENVSASMMLKITRDRAQEWALSRSEQSGRLPWFSAAEQMLEQRGEELRCLLRRHPAGS